MKIIGWIRVGDRAACGGTVVEGDPFCTGHGLAYAFQGARMACKMNCIIAEGYPTSFLTNGRNRVIHGMKTSGQCPLYSTLNDIDGVGNSSGEQVAEKHFLNADGLWIPVKEPASHENKYDEQTQIIVPSVEGLPYFMEIADGRTFSGHTDADGLLPRIDTYGEDEYTVYWGDEALAKMHASDA